MVPVGFEPTLHVRVRCSYPCYGSVLSVLHYGTENGRANNPSTSYRNGGTQPRERTDKYSGEVATLSRVTSSLNYVSPNDLSLVSIFFQTFPAASDCAIVHVDDDQNTIEVVEADESNVMPSTRLRRQDSDRVDQLLSEIEDAADGELADKVRNLMLAD